MYVCEETERDKETDKEIEPGREKGPLVVVLSSKEEGYCADSSVCSTWEETECWNYRVWPLLDFFPNKHLRPSFSLPPPSLPFFSLSPY